MKRDCAKMFSVAMGPDRQLKLPLPPPRKADLLAMIRDRLDGYEVRQAAREARRRGVAKRRALRAQGLLPRKEDRQLAIPGLETPDQKPG